MAALVGAAVIGVVGLAIAMAGAAGSGTRGEGDAEARSARPAVEAPLAAEGAAAILREARERLAAGDLDTARKRLESLGEVAQVDDYRLLLLARVHAATGNPAGVLAVVATSAREHPGSPLRGPLARLRGDAHAALGDEAEARTAWAEAGLRTRDPEERAELLALQALSHEREQARPDAAAVWLELWTRFPHTEAGQQADVALDRLEPTPGALRTTAARAKRAQRLFDERHNEAALAEVEQVLAASDAQGPTADGDPELPAAAEMRDLRAHLLFRMRRYPDAVKAFEALGDDAEARFWRARALARSGRIDDSIAAFLAVAAGEGGALGARSRFLAGTLHEGEGRKPEARALYAQVAERAPLASQRETARWRLGWMAYRDGDDRRAAELLGQLAQQQDEPLEALRARYWHARALMRGDADALGRQGLQSLVEERPFTYYGLRAGQRVGEAAPRAGSGPLPAPTIRADRLRRLRLLLLAGALDEVRIELPDLLARSRGLADREALAGVLSAAGAYHEAQRLIVDSEQEELARGVDPARRSLWVHAWPRAFPEQVSAAARAAGIPEALLLAVMREESGFRPEVLSSVGARGLVQIMPATGAHLAAKLAWPQFDPDQLFDPETNLTLGARYLRNLLEEFDGRAAAAVAAYNAGENAVARWVDAHGSLEEDEWVEAIPYDQTRSYVRRVLRSLHVYRALYPEAAGAEAANQSADGSALGERTEDVTAAALEAPQA